MPTTTPTTGIPNGKSPATWAWIRQATADWNDYLDPITPRPHDDARAHYYALRLH